MDDKIKPKCFRKGYEAFREKEKRDAMYKVASFLVKNYWDKFPKKSQEMANSIGVLLLTWNQGFYRYGRLDFENLENCLRKHWKTLKSLRNRKISFLRKLDERIIKKLFVSFLCSLKIIDKKNNIRKSPVAVAKALHLLAPRFFPIWDNKIASGYKCHWSNVDRSAEKYWSFCNKMKDMANTVVNYPHIKKDVTLLKLIDEYNYAKYTKKWIDEDC